MFHNINSTHTVKYSAKEIREQKKRREKKARSRVTELLCSTLMPTYNKGKGKRRQRQKKEKEETYLKQHKFR